MLKMVKRAGALALVFVMMISSFVQAAEIGGANDKPVIEVSENEIPENATDSKNDMVSENMAEEDEKTDVISNNDAEEPAGATGEFVIKNNGLGGIYIDLNGSTYQSTKGQMEDLTRACTWFAGARVWELTGNNPGIHWGQGWWNNGKGNYGYNRVLYKGAGNPTEKALACYTNHISVIEAYNNGKFIVSEGGNQPPEGLESECYCQIRERTLTEIENYGGSSGSFLGFVYLGVPFSYDRKISLCGYGRVGQPGSPLEDNQTVSGTVQFWAQRFDSDPNHNGQFRLDGEPLTDLLTADNNGFFSVVVDTGNYNNGSHTLSVIYNNTDWSWTDSKTVIFSNTSSDTTQPVISDVLIQNTTKDGYDVSCVVTDNVGVTKVGFPTWTDKNGQDDIIRYEGKKKNGRWTCRINASNHNYEEGLYHTDIWAYDAAGNERCYGTTFFVDRTAPKISDVKVENVSASGYRVSCTVTDNNEVTSVKFPTWTVENGQDDIKRPAGKMDSSGRYYVDIKRSSFNNQEGEYVTHIYAWDACQNEVSTAGADIVLKSVTGVSLNKKSLTIKPNASQKLTATIAPSDATVKTVTWTSSNTEVATVKNGTVKGIAAGTATITAKSSDGGKKATCEVTVTDGSVSVTGVTLNKKSLSFNKIGDTDVLTATVTPSNATDKTLTWTSSNTKVATVTNGTVKAVGQGTAVITVKTKDGGKTASCGVTVSTSEEIIPVSEIKLNRSSLQIEVGKTAAINATVYPENATNKEIIWKSGEESIVSVSDNGLIEAKALGSTTIMALASGGDVSAVCRIEVVEAEKEESPEDNLKDDDDISIPESMVPDGIWLYGIENCQYSGNEIKPAVKVYDGKKLLVEKRDYTVSFRNNKKAYDYSDEDLAEFKEKLKSTGKRVKVGSFDPGKAPQIIITMKGDYKGKETAYFRIAPQDIAGDDFSSDDIFVKYTGKKQKPSPKVVWNAKALKINTDYTVKEYQTSSYDFIGNESGLTTYELTICGKGNFSGERKIKMNIAGLYGGNGDGTVYAMMDKVTTPKIPDQKYSGKPVSINELVDRNGNSYDLTVSYKGKTLEEGKEYSSEIINNTGCGTAAIILKGTGETDGDIRFIGQKKIFFRITGEDISQKRVIGLKADGYQYTGAKIEPEISVEGVSPDNYVVEYKNNINAGTGYVIVKGKNAYSGEKRVKFPIRGYSVDNLSVSVNGYSSYSSITVPYVKGGAKPETELTYNGKKLVEGRDYSLRYENYNRVATSTDERSPSIIIKGKGNFSGKRTIRYNITLADKSKIKLYAGDITESEKPDKFRTQFIIVDRNGMQLKAGTDYKKEDISYYLYSEDTGITGKKLTSSDRPLAGDKILIKVQGTGNYKNCIFSGTYNVLREDMNISRAEFKIKTQNYTGKAVKIASGDAFQKAVYNSENSYIPLEYGVDYEVVNGSYCNNIKPGTSSLLLHGIGDYSGYKVVSFKIAARPISSWWKGIVRRSSD